MSAPTRPSKDNPPFPVGLAAKRELRNELKVTTDPARTIQQFQQSHSLHTMMAKAFGTAPRHKHKNTRNADTLETLDTDSVMTFLSHLGVSQYEVHKRISDTLLKQLDEDIRNSSTDEPLLELLKTCWEYATTISELRPVLWSVLKQLGSKTPTAVLTALTERDDSGKLKHSEIFRPLPPMLKHLCWEADWSNRIPVDPSNDPTEFFHQAKETLLFETIQPSVEEYSTNALLVEAANRPFVATVGERRILTTQRRALAKTQPNNSRKTAAPLTSGKAVSRLRSLLFDVGPAASYRPKLLFATLSILMAQHGSQTKRFLGGAEHLHCTLVADLLLSAGGHLPKPYTHVLALARTLDDAVQEGNLTDKKLANIQSALKLIFESDGEENKSTTTSQKKAVAPEPDAPSTAVQRQLNRLISSGLAAMKEEDPQHLFLNPVTDAIAPGYSKIINQPMSITTMEQKVASNEYKSISDWEADVKLMFKNCIDYNRGNAGQWFRGEANRQGKVFREEIFPKARRLYQNEIAKRTVMIGDAGGGNRNKRDAGDEGPEITPLAPSAKKRKKEREENIPSMPALASMLLSDPFVVRIILARVLRELRRGVMGGSTIPVAHSVVPSLLQILHVARWSTRTCAIRGRKFFIPSVGLEEPPEEAADPAAAVAYASLRRFLPLLVRLLLEAEIDRRIAPGGDLHQAAQSSASAMTATVDMANWNGNDLMEVPVALVEGSLVHLCHPGNRNDASLSVTFPKFSGALQHFSVSLLEDRLFFHCLIRALLQQKTKLPRATRTAVVEAWLKWLRRQGGNYGSITSAAHECLIFLLNEWSALGNVLLPRDLLLQFTKEAVQSADASETLDKRKFAIMWKSGSEEFEPIKKQYERMLNHLPDSALAKQWKEDVGIADPEETAADANEASAQKVAGRKEDKTDNIDEEGT